MESAEGCGVGQEGVVSECIGHNSAASRRLVSMQTSPTTNEEEKNGKVTALSLGVRSFYVATLWSLAVVGFPAHSSVVLGALSTCFDLASSSGRCLVVQSSFVAS